MLLKGRWVLPVSSPPIENGVVAVEQDRIAFVGAIQELPLRYRTLATVDLPNAILLPGLVNAHCHLEHSALKGLTTPKLPFTEWVKEVARETASLSKGDIQAGMRRAVEPLLRGGSTTVADHAHPDSESLETPFRRIPFWEVLGAHPGRARESLEKARRRAAKEGGLVSPHSLYAVHEEVLEEMFPLHSIHLLESSDEDQFFRQQAGPLAVYVQERGGDLSFPMSSPVQWLQGIRAIDDEGGVAKPPLLIHCNYLNPAEIGVLRGSEASVIHCPGSHRFFGHRRFPLEELRAAGVRIALGTDSLASNEDLSMLREMRLLKETYPQLSEEGILQMATIEGAAALGMDSQIGTIEIGKKADLIAVGKGILETDRVVFSMIDGKVILNDV